MSPQNPLNPYKCKNKNIDTNNRQISETVSVFFFLDKFTMNGRAVLYTLLLLLLGFGIGWFTKEGILKRELETEINRLEVINMLRQDSIRELLKESKKIDTLIIEKKEIIKDIETRWKIEKEKIKILPIDSSVSLLRKNLESYEWTE